jgi:hypothetical protein
MQYHLYKKILLFLIILIIMLQSYQSSTNIEEDINSSPKDEAFQKYYLPHELKTDENKCYGFIIKIPDIIEISNNPQTQYEVLNLINILIRNNISVYWLQNDDDLFTKELFINKSPEFVQYKRGSFFIPLTENPNLNSLTIVILSEHYLPNNSFGKETIPLKIDMILEPKPNLKLYKINEPKLAYYFDQGVTTTCINWYISTLYKAGFLNNEILEDEDLQGRLNNNNFNVLIWPGGNMIESFNNDLNFISKLKKQYSIKNFISNGGGFVGSCYGAFIASSGMRFTPFLLYQYYLPLIPSFWFLSLSDTLLALGMPSNINVTIEDSDNPVVFGLNGTLSGSVIRGGPVYTWIGKNSESLAKVDDINLSWFNWIESSNNTILKKFILRWVNFTIGKTIWISSTYGSGKIVAFGDHPEQGDIKLQRAVHNSVLFVTSKSIEDYIFEDSYSISLIEEYGKNSLNITYSEYNSDLFNIEYNKIEHTINILNEVENKYKSFSTLIRDLMEYENIETNFYYQVMSGGFWGFDEFIYNSENYLDNPENNEDTLNELKSIDSIYNMYLFENNSIYDITTSFKNKIGNRFELINNSLILLNKNIDQLINEIQNYINTSDQNEIIFNLIDNIEINKKDIQKNLPLIYFDSLILSKDLWYTYKTMKLDN